MDGVQGFGLSMFFLLMHALSHAQVWARDWSHLVGWCQLCRQWILHPSVYPHSIWGEQLHPSWGRGGQLSTWVHCLVLDDNTLFYMLSHVQHEISNTALFQIHGVSTIIVKSALFASWACHMHSSKLEHEFVSLKPLLGPKTPELKGWI